MQPSIGISRREYEQLPVEVKIRAGELFEVVKADLRHRGFSLNFLGHDRRWKDLTPSKFLGFPEDYYQRLVRGSKLVRRRSREDQLEQISELYDLVRQSPKVEDRSLEFSSKATSTS